MAHKNAIVTLASAVASAGTFTVGYPTDTSAGSFAGHGHLMVCDGLQGTFSQDLGGMSVAFGASDITVTYRGSTSIPAGSRVTVQLQLISGAEQPVPVPDLIGAGYASTIFVDLGAPDAADDNGIVESQNLTSAGVYSTLAFNGVYGDPYSNLKAVLDVPRNVVAAWTGNAQLTVTGLDVYGDVVVEKSSAATTSLTGKKAFKVITSIATDSNITALTVGTGDVLGLPLYVEKIGEVLAEFQDGVALARFGPQKILIPFYFNQTDLLAPTAANLIAPCAGYITGIRAIVQAAVTTGGAITVEANTVAVVGLSVTVANSATAGTVHSDDVLKIATGLCAAGDDITVTPAAAFDTAGRVDGYLIFEPIASLNGTFVAGVQTLPTATTGDVRGTYDPAEVCDGSKAFGLLVRTTDPTYRGVDNYDG